MSDEPVTEAVLEVARVAVCGGAEGDVLLLLRVLDAILGFSSKCRSLPHPKNSDLRMQTYLSIRRPPASF